MAYLTCPWCQAEIYNFSGADEVDTPTPGCASICWLCTGPGMFELDETHPTGMTIRKATKPEMRSLARQPHVKEAVEAIIKHRTSPEDAVTHWRNHE